MPNPEDAERLRSEITASIQRVVDEAARLEVLLLAFAIAERARSDAAAGERASASAHAEGVLASSSTVLKIS